MVIKVKYNGEWVKIPYLSSDHGQELVEEAPKDGSQYARQNGVWSVVNIPEVDFTEVYEAIDTKVDKVDGKGLSTNDYITADKTKVTNVNEVIETAARSVTATGISITLDKRNLVTNAVENIELDLPASTTALAGLMLPSDKTKLNGIAAGAEVNVNADWNATEGDAFILNKPTLATVATSGSYNDLTNKPTIPTWEDIPDLEERYAYGVEWDTASSNPDGVRVGNMQLHRELPIQSKIRGVILDNKGGIKSYLNNSNWGNINTEYLTESVMTEIPEHWYKLYQDGTKFRMMLSAMPLPGYNHIDQFYISSFESGIDRGSSTLISSYGVGSTNVNKRGGDNTSEWDGTYRSLLGCPVTYLTRDQFRQAARKRGSGWEMYTYGAHKTLFWLFAVEYATLNSQKPFNAQKDANGFSQGGLGEGASQMTDWINFNNANPLIPCGYTNKFGNGSGEKAYVVKNASDGTHTTLMANRYRGIENPFGHVWKYTDGANIQVTTGDAGLSILWTTDDPSNFSDTSYTGYDKKGNICRTSGYAKKMLLGENGDIIPTEVDGSSSTYWCDYYRTTITIDGIFVVLAGSSANGALGNSLASIYGGYTSNSARDIGTRLCFFPKYKSTEITTTTE